MFRGTRSIFTAARIRARRSKELDSRPPSPETEPSGSQPTEEADGRQDAVDGVSQDDTQQCGRGRGTDDTTSTSSESHSESSQQHHGDHPFSIFEPLYHQKCPEEPPFVTTVHDQYTCLEFDIDTEGSISYAVMCQALKAKKKIPYASRAVIDITSVYFHASSNKPHSYVAIFRAPDARIVFADQYDSLETYGREKVSFFHQQMLSSAPCRLIWDVLGTVDEEHSPAVEDSFFEIIPSSTGAIKISVKVDLRYSVMSIQ